MKDSQTHFINRSYLRYWLLLGFAVILFSLGSLNSEPAARAPSPPLGWNSFDSYGVYLHEEAAMANIEAMHKKLQPYGYEYFVVDNGWFGEYGLQEGTMYPAEKHAGDIRINKWGHFIPSKVYFPKGLKPLADRCHELGLKFGVHLMRGIPRKAYDLDVPIKGTKYTARDIADTNPKENCKWCEYCYAVDMSKPGAQEWYDGLIKHIVDMGVDFIKYDDIVPHPDEVEAVAKAIQKTGKPIMFSLSPGGKVDPADIASFHMANMLRVTKDVWDEQGYIDACFDAWKKWQGTLAPDFWIDMDMIPFGQLQVMSPPGKALLAHDKGDIALAGHGTLRWCQLNKDQMRTFITMRALAASPLMMGGDLPSLDDFSLQLITNRDMLACNQNGVMGHLVSAKDGVEIWRTPLKGDAKKGWVGVFNRTPKKKIVILSLEDLEIDAEVELKPFEVWSNLPFFPGEDYEIPPYGVLFIRIDELAHE